MHRAHAAQAEEGRAEQRTGYHTLGRENPTLCKQKWNVSGTNFKDFRMRIKCRTPNVRGPHVWGPNNRGPNALEVGKIPII